VSPAVTGGGLRGTPHHDRAGRPLPRIKPYAVAGVEGVAVTGVS
jgi:hypothetical protein